MKSCISPLKAPAILGLLLWVVRRLQPRTSGHGVDLRPDASKSQPAYSDVPTHPYLHALNHFHQNPALSSVTVAVEVLHLERGTLPHAPPSSRGVLPESHHHGRTTKSGPGWNAVEFTPPPANDVEQNPPAKEGKPPPLAGKQKISEKQAVLQNCRPMASNLAPRLVYCPILFSWNFLFSC